MHMDISLNNTQTVKRELMKAVIEHTGIWIEKTEDPQPKPTRCNREDRNKRSNTQNKEDSADIKADTFSEASSLSENFSLYKWVDNNGLAHS